MPVILLLLLSVLAVAGVMVLAAREQDRSMAEQSGRLVAAALDQAQARLGATVRDYAAWDDAVRNLTVTPDPAWAQANIGTTLLNSFGIDAVLLLDDRDAILLRARDGRLQEPREPAEPLSEDLAELARRTRDMPGLSVPATGLTVLDGVVYVVAAADLRWQSGEKPDPGGVLMMLDRVDAAFLDTLDEPLVVGPLRVQTAGTPSLSGAVTLALNDARGRPVGQLAWEAPSPGLAFLNRIWIFLIVIIAIMIGLTALFLSRAQNAVALQVRTAHRLALSERRYRQLVETLPDLIGVVKDGRIVLMNGGGAAILGLACPSDAKGRLLEEYLDEPERSSFRIRLANAPMLTGAFWHRSTLRRPDGGSVPVDLALVSPEEGTDGTLVVVARDVSADAHARERMRQAEAQAELADRAKGQFLANISHELRTPLNAIIGFSEILRDELLGPLGNAQYREYVVDIYEGGLHLLRLVNDLLDLARIDAGRLELREAWIDMHVLIDRCRRLVAQRAQEQGIALETTVEVEELRLLADEMRLKQVIVNLLSNAIRFSARGGAVRLSASVDTGGSFILTVTDHGVGMTPDSIRLALLPFGQVEGGHNRRQPGAGLGLPLAKGYVEAHGGQIGITSTPAVGTTVTVTLPRSRLFRGEIERA